MTRRTQRLFGIALVTCLGVTALPAPAQQPAQAGAQTAPSADAKFALKASAGGMGEIALSELAVKNSDNDGVKNFAGTMVTDHTEAGEKLKHLATTKNLTTSQSPLPEQANAASQMKNLKGKAFDTKYIAIMKKDHAETIALFKKEAASGQDPELKAFASSTLPTLEHHADMAAKLTP